MARLKLIARQIRFPINRINRDALLAKLNDHDSALDAIGGDGTAATISEAVTSGAINPVVMTSSLNIVGTQAFTLANGTYIGQMKTIRTVTATSTPVGTCTGTFVNGGTTAGTISGLGSTSAVVMLVWNGTQWDVNYHVTVTFS